MFVDTIPGISVLSAIKISTNLFHCFFFCAFFFFFFDTNYLQRIGEIVSIQESLRSKHRPISISMS